MLRGMALSMAIAVVLVLTLATGLTGLAQEDDTDHRLR